MYKYKLIDNDLNFMAITTNTRRIIVVSELLSKTNHTCAHLFIAPTPIGFVKLSQNII